MSGKVKLRNDYIDFIRGIAILLVILGHTISGSSKNFSNSIIHQIIWTIQMPLFFVISGFLTSYLKEIDTVEKLKRYCIKRTISYLGPWFIWTLFIRNYLFSIRRILTFPEIFWNMDSGYWFLVSLWMIAIIFGISEYLSYKIFKSKKYIIVSYIGGMILLLIIGKIFGLNFLGIKLTVYYMLFYFLGYLYSRINFIFKNRENIKEIGIGLSFLIWVALICRYNFFEIDDNIFGISVRLIASITGVISIIGLLDNFQDFLKEKCAFLKWGGVNSLELYLFQYIFLNYVKFEYIPVFDSFQGLFLIVLNFILVILLSVIVISLIKNNKFLNFIFFAK